MTQTCLLEGMVSGWERWERMCRAIWRLAQQASLERGEEWTNMMAVKLETRQRFRGTASKQK